MMALDKLNNLDRFPLINLDRFVDSCLEHDVHEVNITGSNTDPMLYKHMEKLRSYLQARIPNLIFGIRTNGVLVLERWEVWQLFDKASISLCSFDPNLYIAMMGRGAPPNLEEILKRSGSKPVKMNIILGPEIVDEDLFTTLDKLADMGIKKVNLREPYGQPHIGDPMAAKGLNYFKQVYGMPCYIYKGIEITYWDVHYVEVESVNLYSSGHISVTYPVSKGHHPVKGEVHDQTYFPTSGRLTKQWNYKTV